MSKGKKEPGNKTWKRKSKSRLNLISQPLYFAFAALLQHSFFIIS